MTPTALDIIDARRRLQGPIRCTPLHHSDWLSQETGARVSLKLENVQLTGSFKIRGAFNALMKVAKDRPAQHRGTTTRAIVTASAGNHGRAIAYAAQRLGLRATVFAPRTAPQTKLLAIRRHGATVKETATYDEAEEAARVFAAETVATYV